MDNISPSPTSRISPSTPGDEKNSADPRGRKTVKPQPATKKNPPPPEIEIAGREETHKLDELA
jgi:hypothetical protein